MKRIFLLIFGILILVSCVKKREGEKLNTITSRVVKVSDNEREGVAAAIAFYGGLCQRHKGFITKNGDKKKYFELEMLESDLLNQYANIIEIPASNIAYLFFKHLDTDKSKYDFVRVTIKLNDGNSPQFDYSIEQLELLSTKVPIILKTADLIKMQNYQGLLGLFDKDFSPDLSSEQLKEFCSKYDSLSGAVDSMLFQGFSFFKADDSVNEMLSLWGILVRENQNTPINITVNPDIEDREDIIHILKFTI